MKDGQQVVPIARPVNSSAQSVAPTARSIAPVDQPVVLVTS